MGWAHFAIARPLSAWDAVVAAVVVVKEEGVKNEDAEIGTEIVEMIETREAATGMAKGTGASAGNEAMGGLIYARVLPTTATHSPFEV